MNIKRTVLNLIQMDHNYPNCLVMITNKENWERYISSGEQAYPNTIPELEIIFIGKGIEQAEKWLDSHTWELLDVDPMSGRPVIEMKEKV